MAELASITNEQLRHLLEVSRTLAGTVDLDVLLARIAAATAAVLSCERASIFLHDPATGELWTKVALQSSEIRVPATAGIVGAAFTANQVLVVPEPYSDARFNQQIDKRTGFVTRNLLAAPMIDLEKRPVGVIQAVNKLAGGFTPTDEALVGLLADQAGVAVQRHQFHLEAIASVALRREMELASRVQEALIPRKPPQIAGLEATGWTHFASTTGGDCFDLWKLRDGRLAVLVADASGHGLAPALVVSQTRTLVRALSEIESDPHAILGRVNQRLTEDLQMGRFVTAFLGFLTGDGQLEWSSAGHGPVFIRPRPQDELAALDPTEMPLGVSDQWSDHPSGRSALGPGGGLIVVSDGIFEAAAKSGEQVGVPRLTQTLDAARDQSGQDTINGIRSLVVNWQGRDEPADDQTIVVVRRC